MQLVLKITMIRHNTRQVKKWKIFSNPNTRGYSLGNIIQTDISHFFRPILRYTIRYTERSEMLIITHHYSQINTSVYLFWFFKITHSSQPVFEWVLSAIFKFSPSIKTFSLTRVTYITPHGILKVIVSHAL